MLAIDFFYYPAKLLAWFYELSNSYTVAISLMALVVMVLTAPLVLKSTKGMLEMQKLQPEMRRLQHEHRGDRQRLNEEMMKLYQSHKVNPLASCLPLLLQFPVFIIMFRVLHGLTDKAPGTNTFDPNYIEQSTTLYQSLVGKTEMLSVGLDLARRPIDVLGDSVGKGLIYCLLVVALGALYFVQQKMVAARATISPQMSVRQQKLMQYLPVVFAVFLFFYITGLVVYYIAQAIFRIGLQAYITRKFYRGDESLGRQAMAASERAREFAKANPSSAGKLEKARRDLAEAKALRAKGGRPEPRAAATSSKRVTPPKNRPTPPGGSRATRPTAPNRPAPSNRPGGSSRSKKK